MGINIPRIVQQPAETVWGWLRDNDPSRYMAVTIATGGGFVKGFNDGFAQPTTKGPKLGTGTTGKVEQNLAERIWNGVREGVKEAAMKGGGLAGGQELRNSMEEERTENVKNYKEGLPPTEPENTTGFSHLADNAMEAWDELTGGVMSAVKWARSIGSPDLDQKAGALAALPPAEEEHLVTDGGPMADVLEATRDLVESSEGYRHDAELQLKIENAIEEVGPRLKSSPIDGSLMKPPADELPDVPDGTPEGGETPDGDSDGETEEGPPLNLFPEGAGMPADIPMPVENPGRAYDLVRLEATEPPGDLMQRGEALDPESVVSRSDATAPDDEVSLADQALAAIGRFAAKDTLFGGGGDEGDGDSANHNVTVYDGVGANGGGQTGDYAGKVTFHGGTTGGEPNFDGPSDPGTGMNANNDVNPGDTY